MKNRRTRIIGLLLIVGLIATALIYNYTFNKAHRDIAGEEPMAFLSATELQNAFIENESDATTKYLDKVIQAQGEITSIDNNEVTLNNSVLVDFNENELQELQTGTTLTIKGRCIGFDELLEVVRMDQATLIEN